LRITPGTGLRQFGGFTASNVDREADDEAAGHESWLADLASDADLRSSSPLLAMPPPVLSAFQGGELGVMGAERLEDIDVWAVYEDDTAMCLKGLGEHGELMDRDAVALRDITAVEGEVDLEGILDGAGMDD
jgi:hypothetical protein